ncbi:MAG: EAL domain-containing protein [Pleomorphochaeta sp.]
MIITNKGVLHKKDLIRIIKISLLFIIPFSLISISLYNYTFKIQKENTINLIVEETEERANTISSIVSYIKKNVVVDLLVVKKAQEFNDFLDNPNVENIEKANQLFYRIALNKNEFDQIRYIDKNGYEALRVNNTVSGVDIVDSQSLQYKGDRYYFQEAKKLEKDNIYFSKLDLNIENNKVVEPYLPIIRVVSPIYNENNEFNGILIINYKAQVILDLCDEQINKLSHDFVSMSLVNEEGYYLYNKDIEKSFSFMFDDKDYNLNKDSLLFNINKESGIKYYEEEDKIFSIVQLDKFKDIEVDTIDHWYLVSSFIIDDIPIVKESFIFNMNKNQLIFILLVQIFIVALVIIFYLRNKDKEQISLISKISDVTNDSIVITDNNFNIIYVNKAYKNMMGFEEHELIGKKINSFKSGMHPKEFYSNIINSLSTLDYWEGEIWNKKKDGLLFPKLLKIYETQKKYSNTADKYIAIYSDIERIEEQVHNYDLVDNFDKLTKLPNERLLIKLVNNILETKINVFGLFCFSIINYNQIFINTSEKNKNEILNQYLNELRIYLRKDDIFAQISKDSFVIGLSSFNNLNQIKKYIQNFFEYNNKKTINIDNPIIIDIRGGVSIYPKDNLSAKGLLQSANMALTEAIEKNDYYCFFNREIKEKIEEKSLMSVLLRKSIDNEELNMKYQPQVKISGNKVVGIEALLRWNNPTLGVVSPFFFIPIAEKSGFIIDLGYWVIEKVFSDYKYIKDILPPSFKISINISPLQFSDKNLTTKIIELANKYNVDLSKFEIEITESIILSDFKKINEKLDEFKQLGISIAIDDFGTGFSSLSYLRNLKIDKIKIDRSFIKDYPTKDSGIIAKIIVNMASVLNLQVITEGVETEEQLNYISSIKCELVQGYYYSKPLTINNFIEYFNKSK